MKICAIICEYNPFHNGHLYQLREAKRLSGADFLLCIMSGNFVQRGENAVLEKHVRAKHAVLAGADVVVELPTPFATSNAELFAKGAISILRTIPAVNLLCFGAENANKPDFFSCANALNDEPIEVSKKIKALTADGYGYARARAEAWTGILTDGMLSSPNNILGIEYARAILSQNANIDILPIIRLGNDYNDDRLTGVLSSATAIRTAIEQGSSYQNALPDFVEKDLSQSLPNGLDLLEKYALLSTPTEEIARVCDCVEGLENAFKKAALLPAHLEETLTSPRYTSARIRRIALQNLLKIDEILIRKCLNAPLYLRILAIKKQNKELLSLLSESPLPLLIRGRDGARLEGIAKECYEKDLFAEKVYSLLSNATIPKDIFV